MKRKLIIALLFVTALAGLVSYEIFYAMKDVTFKLGNIISIYKIQTMREKLGFQLRRVQEELVAKDTPYETIAPDTIINDVEEMSQTMHSCFGCHHEKQTDELLNRLQSEVDDFKTALSRVFTISANSARYQEAAEHAYERGEVLLLQVDEMLSAASGKIEQRSNIAMAEALDIMQLVTFTMFALPVCMLLAGLYFMRSITRPIASLIEATDKLSRGQFDYRVSGLKDEFNKLGNSFNVMADSLVNQMNVAQRAEQMTVVGQMAAGLAHEIKNPLAGIKVSMEVLKDESYIHDQDRQVLAMVITVINRIDSLINDLLNFARPSDPCLQSIAINTLLEQITSAALYSLARPHADNNDTQPSFTCHTALAPNLANVKADPGQVQQIVLNLIINAFDAMPKGGTVTVTSGLAPIAGFVTVTVTDTGPGINPAIKGKIFIPFFSSKKKGTGLGLAICKSLAEQNGGALTVNDNVAGGGASFSLFLPIADAPEL